MKKFTRRDFLKAAGSTVLVSAIASTSFVLPASAEKSTAVVSPDGYKKGDSLILSGSILFDEEPETIESMILYKLNDGTKTYKLASFPSYYPYEKAEFTDHILTLECVYWNYENGYDIVLPLNLIEGENKTALNLYIIARYCQADGNPDFKLLLESCFSNSDKYMELSEDGKTLKIDTNPYNLGGTDLTDIAGQLDMSQGQKIVEKVNELMGLPSYVWYEMSQTRALDGTQKEVVGNVTITWTYHPHNGLEVLYFKK